VESISALSNQAFLSSPRRLGEQHATERKKTIGLLLFVAARLRPRLYRDELLENVGTVLFDGGQAERRLDLVGTENVDRLLRRLHGFGGGGDLAGALVGPEPSHRTLDLTHTTDNPRVHDRDDFEIDQRLARAKKIPKKV
jgi:hypothetical protein